MTKKQLTLPGLLRTHWHEILLGIAIVLYIGFFSWLSILRMNTQYAHYFDLGIMHQTTYNTYKAITEGDLSRFLELTDPYGPNQIKRMAIHNDMILAVLAPLYIFHSGPETLLVVQSIALGLGALGLYLIGVRIFATMRYAKLAALCIAIAYLFSPALHFTNLFDFHGVVLATCFLIFMFYFWLVGRYKWSTVFFVLAILTKEQVALTTAFFGLYVLFVPVWEKIEEYLIARRSGKKTVFAWREIHVSKFGLFILVTSIAWFLLIMKVVIPASRGGTDHFALDYYEDFGDSPISVITGLLFNPQKLIEYFLNEESRTYLYKMLFPVGFLSFLSPLTLAISAPEFGVVLLSKNPNLRNIYYHYSAVITPFVYISAIIGVKRFAEWLAAWKKPLANAPVILVLSTIMLLCTAFAAYSYGPLPGAQQQAVHPIKYPPGNMNDAFFWASKLQDEDIRVASTGKLGPFFTSRRYYYLMSDRYKLADYVIVNADEVYNSYGSEWAIPGYEQLLTDKAFVKIYDNNNIEVYEKVQP